MKYILIAVLFCTSMVANASQYCASKASEESKIQDILSQVNFFGTWTGTHDGKQAIVEVTKTSTGKFNGKVTMGDDVVGPTGISVCDYGGQYSVKVYFYEADFTIISKNKIAITLPMDGNPVVVMTRQK